MNLSDYRSHVVIVQTNQTGRYRTRYRHAWKWAFRFDVHYRVRRLRELLANPLVSIDGGRILEVGFGTGHLLRCFPLDCTLHGAEVSKSAVERASQDPIYRCWRGARFTQVKEEDPEDLPAGPFDVVVSSHTLEHVKDDVAHLQSVFRRVVPGGWFLLFVPIEEPGYNFDHVHCYSPRRVAQRVRAAGFDVVFQENSMNVNGHVWKAITIPSRRRYRVLGPVVDALRLTTLSMLPYRLVRGLDRTLDAAGFGPRQSFVIARRPAES